MHLAVQESFVLLLTVHTGTFSVDSYTITDQIKELFLYKYTKGKRVKMIFRPSYLG